MSSQKFKLGRYTVEVSRADKDLFPPEGITKADLAGYYRDIAPAMLPHLKQRPLTMHRFPDGISGEGFYHKEAPDYFPKWFDRVEVKLRGERGSQQQLVCANSACLVYLADQACIEPHVWLSRVDRLEYPDKLIFDLDPPGADFEPVRRAARLLRKLLDEIGLQPFLMTTGSRGLHLVVPLRREDSFDSVRDFANTVAQVLARRYPDELTTETLKGKRKGRLFLDYLRNAYGQTSISPYAVRARPGAPVATPLNWSELGSTGLHARTYKLSNIMRRLGQKDDPWRDIRRHARSLHQPKKRLKQIIGG